MTKSVEEAVKIITEYMEREKPHLFTIDKQIQKVDNGIVNISVRVYKGRVTDVVLTDITKIVIKQHNGQKGQS